MKSIMTAAAAAALTCAVAAGPQPRYKLLPGQEITYRTTGGYKYGSSRGGERERRQETDWTVWVVRANADGSTRLVVRQAETEQRTVDGKEVKGPTMTQLVYVDLFPDGRILPNPSIRYRGHPGKLFPRLPKDAGQAIEGWSWQKGDATIVATPMKTDGKLSFRTESQSAMNTIYVSTQTATYNFDPDKGVVSAISSASTQGYGFVSKGEYKTELLGVKKTAADVHKTLAAQHELYFKALAAYNEALQEASDPKKGSAEQLLADARAALELADKSLTFPALKENLKTQLARHGQMAKYTIQKAARLANIIGKPADPFETEDIDGTKVKLADLKGKVVVLDFWYRGCGWCIRAMPQINELAEDFAGKPVAILGMNTDRKEKDARFVIETMKLKYPTLKATGLPEKFGVTGFPTLVIIDRRGVVHDMHVGYSPTLRKDVGRQIDTLLKK